MTSFTSSPPLFVRLTRAEGGLPLETLINKGDRNVDISEGKWHCEVFAPNGQYAQGWLNARKHQEYYPTVCSLFGDFPLEDLWLDKGGRKSSKGYDGKRLFLCAWANGKMLDNDVWNFVQPQPTARPYLFKISLEGPVEIDHLQIWAPEGPSVLLPCENNATFVLATGSPNHPGEIAAKIIGEKTVTNAYWGFVRNNINSAAELIGATIADSVLSVSTPSFTLEQLLVAGHWSIAFQRKKTFSDHLYSLLRNFPDSTDAQILSWALDFDDVALRGYDNMVSRFFPVLRAVRLQHPRYSPVFKLFLERLSSAQALAAKSNYYEKEGALEWAYKLGASTYWDNERLVYRGSSPSDPDPSASELDLPENVKKKHIQY